jgi:hypothetical protein
MAIDIDPMDSEAVANAYSQLRVIYVKQEVNGTFQELGTNLTKSRIPEGTTHTFYEGTNGQGKVYAITFKGEVAEWGTLSGVVALSGDFSRTVGLSLFSFPNETQRSEFASSGVEQKFSEGITLVNGTVLLVEGSALEGEGRISAIAGATVTSLVISEKLGESFRNIRLLVQELK